MRGMDGAGGVGSALVSGWGGQNKAVKERNRD